MWIKYIKKCVMLFGYCTEWNSIFLKKKIYFKLLKIVTRRFRFSKRRLALVLTFDYFTSEKF